MRDRNQYLSLNLVRILDNFSFAYLPLKLSQLFFERDSEQNKKLSQPEGKYTGLGVTKSCCRCVHPSRPSRGSHPGQAHLSKGLMRKPPLSNMSKVSCPQNVPS